MRRTNSYSIFTRKGHERFTPPEHMCLTKEGGNTKKNSVDSLIISPLFLKILRKGINISLDCVYKLQEEFVGEKSPRKGPWLSNKYWTKYIESNGLSQLLDDGIIINQRTSYIKKLNLVNLYFFYPFEYFQHVQKKKGRQRRKARDTKHA